MPRASGAELPLFVVDAFAELPFSGNPAAVCLLEESADERWMREVAAEMRHSETAFVTPPQADGRGLRWFTPETEVDLCGHATLATAHVLWETGRVAADETIRFSTRSGSLSASLRSSSIVLDFPATPPEPTEAPEGLAAALGATPVEVHRTPFDLLVRLDSAREVAELSPDLAALGRIAVARGFICTAPGSVEGEEADFTSRFFAPAVGVDEDPVTGSAHCALGPYWAGRLGSTHLTGHQASRRGGRVTLAVETDRVALGGSAVTVLAGTIRAPRPPV